jgi:hypothetical protein
MEVVARVEVMREAYDVKNRKSRQHEKIHRGFA